MFSMFFCLCLCIMCAAYVQMGANLFKCMLHCTPLGIFQQYMEAQKKMIGIIALKALLLFFFYQKSGCLVLGKLRSIEK